jgi:ATP-dependent Clp protease ATP-binding subunit ClpA
VSDFVSKIQIGLEILASEFDSNSELEDKLNNRVFGQSHLIKSLVHNSHVIDDESSTRPHIVMITGTSGAGKSYVARELAHERLQDMNYFLDILATLARNPPMVTHPLIMPKSLGKSRELLRVTSAK